MIIEEQHNLVEVMDAFAEEQSEWIGVYQPRYHLNMLGEQHP